MVVFGRRRVVRATTVVVTAVVLSACGASPSRPAATSAPPNASGPDGSLAGADAPSTSSVAGGGGIGLDLERAAVLDGLGIADLSRATVGRTFTTSFEDPADLAGFYTTPQTALTHHEVTTALARTGTHAEKAWVTGPGAPGVEPDGPNHRGYPTVQLRKLDAGRGGFRSPTIAQFWVWLDVTLQPGQWFSFATFTFDASRRWDRVVTVNLDPDGYVNIFHVPLHNQKDVALQRTDVPFPTKTWVRITAYVDFTPAHGALAVWQGTTLVAAARIDPQVDPTVRGVRDALGLPADELTDRLEQAHFGLYTAPAVRAATVYNDDITIAELNAPG